jgi:AmpD protein
VQINAKTGLIDNINYTASPNSDARPDNIDINLVVIHSISLPPGEYGDLWIERFFCNELDIQAHSYFQEICDLRVSAHILIHREGALQQFVPFNKRAWHAGQSRYEGQEACNDFSIGIELEGTDDSNFEDIQYQQLAKLILSLEKTYPKITRKRMVGHSDIAPGRKTDPGTGFDWDKLNSLLA